LVDVYSVYGNSVLVDQTCNSLKMARIYGRSMLEPCLTNISASCNKLVVKFVYVRLPHGR
jgi:hypothetical protein